MHGQIKLDEIVNLDLGYTIQVIIHTTAIEYRNYDSYSFQ